MAPEANGELTESRSSLDLFESECARRGWNVRRVANGLEIDRLEGALRLFNWPPAVPICKSLIPRLTHESHHLHAVPTQPCEPQLSIDLPVCVKLDVGSLGVGFRSIYTSDDWQAFVTGGGRLIDFVVQPLLSGPERRVTLCADGTFAMADLLERRGTRSRWRDSTPGVPSGWLEDLHSILGRLDTPVIGVDIIESQGVAYLLDINLAPDLAVHLVTDHPRNLAPAVLNSWSCPTQTRLSGT